MELQLREHLQELRDEAEYANLEADLLKADEEDDIGKISKIVEIKLPKLKDETEVLPKKGVVTTSTPYQNQMVRETYKPLVSTITSNKQDVNKRYVDESTRTIRKRLR
jgi:hypothetical protein